MAGVAKSTAHAVERSLRVAVIGAPNSGKSSLTNQLVRATVAAVSSKMDTTLKNQQAVLTEKLCQLVVVDSPGTIAMQHARKVIGVAPDAHLNKNFKLVIVDSPGTIAMQHARKVIGVAPDAHILIDPEAAMANADRIVVVQDASQTGDYILHRVLHMLHRHAHIPASLVLNKLDLVERRGELLPLVRILTKGKVNGASVNTKISSMGKLGKPEIDLHVAVNPRAGYDGWRLKYETMMQKPTHKCSWDETKRLFLDERGWDRFDAVFYVSALLGEGIEPLRQHLIRNAEQRPWQHDPVTLTTTQPQDLCLQTIRAQLLDTVPAHIAYNLDIRLTTWEIQGDVLQIVAEVQCRDRKWGKYVLGGGGIRISTAGRRVNEILQNLFRQQLFVRLLVKHGNEILSLESIGAS